jgi:hypothetical protein
MDWELSESQFEDASGVQTPYNWTFLFAVNLTDEQASLVDNEFSVDLGVLEDAGFELPEIEYQIIMAHVATVDNDPNKPGLRYANKILMDDNAIKLDGQSIEKLGDSVGASGPGWYVAYFSMDAVGFLKGTVTDCNGAVPQGDQVLVNATDGPFWTYASAADGSWALPSVNDKPAAVNFDAGDCSGQDSAPVTDPEDNPNEKDPGTEPPNDPLDDGTNIIDSGDTNLDEDGNPPPGEPSEGTRFEFDDGAAAWDSTGTGQCFDVIAGDDSYGLLFPGGSDAAQAYGLLSTGWKETAGKQSCTVSRTFTVPEGATTMVVSYDFISQEYPEWVGSPYDDIFTVIIQGEYDYAVHRTINAENDWEDLSGDEGEIGWIEESPDAQYNSPAYLFDGHLKWGGTDDNTPRGNNDDNMLYGRVAEYPLPAGVPTITVLITVSDVADAIYDSAGAIDYIEFK